MWIKGIKNDNSPTSSLILARESYVKYVGSLMLVQGNVGRIRNCVWSLGKVVVVWAWLGYNSPKS